MSFDPLLSSSFVSQQPPISWHSPNLTDEERYARYVKRCSMIINFAKCCYQTKKTCVIFRNGDNKTLKQALTYVSTHQRDRAELENITVARVICDKGETLMEDTGTVSLMSDADVTCTIVTMADLNAFHTTIQDMNQSESLSWMYDLNFYMRIVDTSDLHLQETDLSVAKMFLRAKLYRHEVVDSFDECTSFNPEAYRTYTNCMKNMHISPTNEVYESLKNAEKKLYDRMHEEREKNFAPTRLIDHSYSEFFKIEGYVLVSTLRVHLAFADIMNMKMINVTNLPVSKTDLTVAFLENIVDAVIHMTDETVYKKTKYFKRLYTALGILKILTCTSDSREGALDQQITDLINTSQYLHTESRKTGYRGNDLHEKANQLMCNVVDTIRCVYGYVHNEDCSVVNTLKKLTISILTTDHTAEVCECHARGSKTAKPL